MGSSNIVQLSSDNFGSEVKSADKPVLVDFWAEWCGPCKAIAPLLEELAVSYEGRVKIGKVNIDDNAELASEFNITAIPTLVIFKQGQVQDKLVGAVSKKELEGKLSPHIS
jgi:thioredoxin 1